MDLEKKIVEQYRADEEFRQLLNTYYHSYNISKPVIHTPAELAQFFGGVLKVYLECDDVSNALPNKLLALVTHLNTRQKMSNELIQYAASPNLWVGMTFDSSDIFTAIEKGYMGYLKWRATWDTEIYMDAQRKFERALLYDQVEVTEWLLDNVSSLQVMGCIYNDMIRYDCSNVFKLLHQREYISVKTNNIMLACCNCQAFKIGAYIKSSTNLTQYLIDRCILTAYNSMKQESFKWFIPMTNHPTDFFIHCYCKFDLDTIKWFHNQYQPTLSYSELFHSSIYCHRQEPIIRWLLKNYPLTLEQLYQLSDHTGNWFAQRGYERAFTNIIKDMNNQTQ